MKQKEEEMKILLIDDLADKGWKQVLEKAVTQTPIEIATNTEEAKEKLIEKYDLIFLDMRLNETDHTNHKIEEYGGFKVLKEIKNDFKNTNFSTPIILITASNKIWNIDKFKEYGVDFYYIKEHPNFLYSKEFSKENLNLLQENFKKCNDISKDRGEIWNLCKSIIEKVEQQPYFKTKDKRYTNVRERIIDKIKLGYYYLFKTPTTIEQKVLLANNEAMSFIIFWSILEEIVKGYTDINTTWDGVYKRIGDWKFKNGEYFVQNNQNMTYQDGIDYGVMSIINLSTQVHALISCYIKDTTEQKTIRDNFENINSYRNQIDYIHSSVLNIFTKKLIEEENIKECFEKNREILTFINDILEQPMTP